MGSSVRDGSQTRKRIETEAMRLFVERGVAETSMRDVARAVGVTEGALYRHFDGKDALVATLFITRYLELAQDLERLQAEESGTRAKLDRVVGEFCRFFDTDRVLFRFLLFVQHGQLDKLPSDAVTPVDAIRRIVEAGMRARDIPKSDPELSTAMIVGIVLQAATAVVYGRLRGSLSRHRRRLSDAAWSVLVNA
jgi:AcrR family transcriptional regulator